MLFFEVPNVLHIFKDKSYWDVIYEHYSYFSPSSLSCLFASCGFEVLDIYEGFNGQFICIEARPSRSYCWHVNTDSVRAVSKLALLFPDNYRSKVEAWKNILKSMAEGSMRVAVWGSGSKGTAFLNTFSNLSNVDYVVDINPRKHGTYLPVTAQRIVSPEFLISYRPGAVIVMNQMYINEIRWAVKKLNLSVRILTA